MISSITYRSGTSERWNFRVRSDGRKMTVGDHKLALLGEFHYYRLHSSAFGIHSWTKVQKRQSNYSCMRQFPFTMQEACTLVLNQRGRV